MDKNTEQAANIVTLIEEARQGVASEEKLLKLDHILKNDERCRTVFLELSYMDSALSRFFESRRHEKSNMSFQDETDAAKVYDEILRELAEDQLTASAIELLEEKTQPNLIQKVVYPPREKRKVSKLGIIFLAMNAAAILFFVLFIKFTSPQGGIEVATLSDSIHAKWADIDTSMQNGTRLSAASNQLILKEGIAELTFDNHAKAIIEAPSEFQILANDRIGLTYGKVSVMVPPRAIGFSVYTLNAKVIDLGTKFGVKAEANGDTQLYVFKGKTSLIAGGDSDTTSMEVTRGTAKRVSGMTGTVSDITFSQRLFVQDINSKTNIVWRGGNVELASIVAGHDGFQEVGSLTGLDPVNAERVTSVNERYRVSNKTYNLVPDSDYIDGVFVPDGEAGAVQITSMGHTFDCPDTLGVYTHEITAYKGSIKNQQTSISPVSINGQEIVNDPILVLHSNAGITFDLQAIRESLPQLSLKGLKSTGIPFKKFEPDLDFYVLVDGQMKYERKIDTINADRGAISFSVEFGPTDRFLTLIVTNGPSDSFANDFFYLIKPELVLQ